MAARFSGAEKQPFVFDDSLNPAAFVVAFELDEGSSSSLPAPPADAHTPAWNSGNLSFSSA